MPRPRPLEAVGGMAWALRERVESLDLNPVIVTADGAFAVDTVLALKQAPPATQV